MWTTSVGWWEFVFRGVVVYVFLLAMLRMTGKRQVGQLATFDLVLLLILSNAVQNSMNAGDNSLVGGLISAGTLVALNYAISLATFRSKAIEGLVEGRPEVLIHNGVLYKAALVRAMMTRHELNMSIRAAGLASLEDVRTAVLETNGVVSVIPWEDDDRPKKHDADERSAAERRAGAGHPAGAAKPSADGTPHDGTPHDGPKVDGVSEPPSPESALGPNEC